MCYLHCVWLWQWHVNLWVFVGFFYKKKTRQEPCHSIELSGNTTTEQELERNYSDKTETTTTKQKEEICWVYLCYAFGTLNMRYVYSYGHTCSTLLHFFAELDWCCRSVSRAQMADANKNYVGSFPPGKKITVVPVIGGPGSGKGTQCAKIVDQFGFTHLSAGDLLREEAKSDTEQGTMIKNLMHEGKLVPSELIVKLLLKAMLASGNDKFLIDGFPRNEENIQAYESAINIEPEFILFIDCPKEEMERRILNRNQGRDDDNINTIRSRFEVFQQSTLPVIQYYEKSGKLRRVDGAKPPDAVFKDVKAIFAQLNTQENHAGHQASGLSRAQTKTFKRWFLDLCCGCFGTQETRN